MCNIMRRIKMQHHVALSACRKTCGAWWGTTSEGFGWLPGFHRRSLPIGWAWTELTLAVWSKGSGILRSSAFGMLQKHSAFPCAHSLMNPENGQVAKLVRTLAHHRLFIAKPGRLPPPVCRNRVIERAAMRPKPAIARACRAWR
jgi:hypothetical protein